MTHQENYSFFEQVLNPKGAYSGQKLIKLVKINTAASTNRTIPQIPVTVFVKWSTIKIAAKINRMKRSVEPMFFFIVFGFS